MGDTRTDPKFTYKIVSSVMDGKSSDCGICAEPLNNRSGSGRVSVISNRQNAAPGPVSCGHKFHEDCIFEWVYNKNYVTCPTCRGDIQEIYIASSNRGGKRRKSRRSRRSRRSTRKN